jgi:hypothetical protein
MWKKVTAPVLTFCMSIPGARSKSVYYISSALTPTAEMVVKGIRVWLKTSSVGKYRDYHSSCDYNLLCQLFQQHAQHGEANRLERFIPAINFRPSDKRPASSVAAVNLQRLPPVPHNGRQHHAQRRLPRQPVAPTALAAAAAHRDIDTTRHRLRGLVSHKHTSGDTAVCCGGDTSESACASSHGFRHGGRGRV